MRENSALWEVLHHYEGARRKALFACCVLHTKCFKLCFALCSPCIGCCKKCVGCAGGCVPKCDLKKCCGCKTVGCGMIPCCHCTTFCTFCCPACCPNCCCDDEKLTAEQKIDRLTNAGKIQVVAADVSVEDPDYIWTVEIHDYTLQREIVAATEMCVRALGLCATHGY